MNSKNTKRALLSSVVAMLVCFTMLLSTTFAWFTDTAVSASNVITAGNLDVVVEYTLDGENWDDLDGADDLFQKGLWEPGHTEVVALRIKNNGTLALKYTANMNIVKETIGKTADNKDIKLSDILTVGTLVQEVNQFGDIAVALAFENENMYKGTTAFKDSAVLEQDQELSPGAAHYVIIKVDMAETVGNEANYRGTDVPTIEFGVNVLATQFTYENDSFGNQYDKDSEYAVTAKTGDDLRTALDIGGNVVVEGDMNVTGTVDVPTWTNAPAEYVIDGTWVNSVTGGNYTLDEASKYGIVARVSAGEVLELSDMTVTANSQWPMYLSNYGGTLTLEDIEVTATQGAGVYPYGTAGTTTLENVKVNQERLDPAYQATTPWAGTAVASSNGHNLVINSGVYVGSTWAVYGYNSGSTITINGGTFKAPTVIQLDGVWSGSNKSVAIINGGDFDGRIHLDWGTNVPELYINGGNFTNFSATVYGAAKLVITGGTFDADPSAWVATGYVATETNGVWTVVAE